MSRGDRLTRIMVGAGTGLVTFIGLTAFGCPWWLALVAACGMAGLLAMMG